MTSRILWKVNNQSMATSAPTYTLDAGVVFCSRGGRVTCVDAVSGDVRWQFQGDSPIECSPVVHPNGSILVGDYSGCIRVFSSEGILLWSLQIQRPIMTSGCIDDAGNFWIGDDGGWLHQLRSDGQRMYRIRLTDLVTSSPLYHNKNVYLADEALRGTNGTVTPLTVESGVSPMAVGLDGTVIVGSWDGVIRAIRTGSIQWTAELNGQIYGGCSVDEFGNIYVGTRRGEKVALTSNGKQIWSRTFKDGVYGTPALSKDGLCFVGCNDRYLYALDRRSGEPIWKERCGRELRSSPLLCPDGTVVVSCWDYTTYAFRGDGGGHIQKSWSQFQGNPYRQGSSLLL